MIDNLFIKSYQGDPEAEIKMDRIQHLCDSLVNECHDLSTITFISILACTLDHYQKDNNISFTHVQDILNQMLDVRALVYEWAGDYKE